jgi:hypothetical protein
MIADSEDTASAEDAAIIPPAPTSIFLRVIDMLGTLLDADMLYTSSPTTLLAIALRLMPPLEALAWRGWKKRHIPEAFQVERKNRLELKPPSELKDAWAGIALDLPECTV